MVFTNHQRNYYQQTKLIEKIWANNTLTPTLQKLLKKSGVILKNKSLRAVVDATQKNWLRKPNQERCDIKNKLDFKKFKPLLKTLGLYDEVTPSQASYDYCLVLGSFASCIVKRYKKLINLIDNDIITVKNIVLLGSNRPLNTKVGESLPDLQKYIEQQEISFNTKTFKKGDAPKTEFEIMYYIFNHINMPENIKNIPVIYINAQGLTEENGTFKRATTADTVHAFLQEVHNPGKCLAISNQPYTTYQQLVLQDFLDNVETCGTTAHEKTVEKYLDTLARCLYQLHNSKKNK